MQLINTEDLGKRGIAGRVGKQYNMSNIQKRRPNAV